MLEITVQIEEEFGFDVREKVMINIKKLVQINIIEVEFKIKIDI